MPQFIDYYVVLGLSVRASSSEIKKAYDILKNEQSRNHYDQVYERYYTPSPRPQPVKARKETNIPTPKKYIPLGSYVLIGLIILLCLFTIFSFFSESFFHQ